MESSRTIAARLERVISQQLGANVTRDELLQAERLDDLVALDSVALLEFSVGVEHEFSIVIEKERFNRAFMTDLPALIAFLERL